MHEAQSAVLPLHRSAPRNPRPGNPATDGPRPRSSGLTTETPRPEICPGYGRHGIFRVNARDAQGGDGKTEFGRVVERLDIELINAQTPQARGRVERANQTLQDRLIKEMRLEGISSLEEAQAFAPRYIEIWNDRFAVAPRDPADAHRPWTQGPLALDEALARREERVLSKALTFSAEGTRYCVKTAGAGIAMRGDRVTLRGARVTLRHFLDGSLQVSHKDRILACTAFRQLPRPSPAEDEKTLNARVEAVIAASALARREGVVAAQSAPIARQLPGDRRGWTAQFSADPAAAAALVQMPVDEIPLGRVDVLASLSHGNTR